MYLHEKSHSLSVFFNFPVNSRMSQQVYCALVCAYSCSYDSWKVLEHWNEKLLIGLRGEISYIPWCIASYYIIMLPNARDPISSTRMWQLNNGGKQLVLPIKLSVPLLCRSIYDFSFTIPNTSLVESKKVFWPPNMS